MPKDKARRLSVAYVVAPAIALLFALPWQLMLPLPGTPKHTAAPLWLQFAIVPFWLGLAAVPGYLYVWSERWRSRVLSPLTVAWIHLSLAVAVLASALGAAYLLLTVIGWVFAAISGCLAIHLWIRFWRARRSS